MSGAHSPLPFEAVDPLRFREVQHSTRLSVVVNVALVVLQLAVGWLAHAQSLIADGLHSASDLLADFLVLYANRKGADPADGEHPYGHGRIETAASFLLGAILLVTGVGLLLGAGARLASTGHLPDIHPAALWVALGTLAAKEGLFRYMLGVATRLHSPMLVANAWHARSDAASSLVVAAGIGGALAGYRFLDLLAAALVGFLIARMGWKYAYDAMRELVDTGLSAEDVAAIRRILLDTPGVVDCHELRTRRMAHQVLVDAHVQVDGRISVSEGHRIAESARARVLEGHHGVLDVLVHVDAECDMAPEPRALFLPERPDLMAHLTGILGAEVPLADRPMFHFLGAKVEADVFLPADYCADAQRLAALRRRIADALIADPYFRVITLNCRSAP